MKAQKLNIESRTDQLVAVREFVSQAALEFGFTDEEVSKIALAVDEACTNIIKHAYKFDSRQRITISVREKNSAFEVSIRDSGLRFNPDEIEIPDMKEYLTYYRRGGLGMYLMKSLMDEVEYDIRPGKKNEVRMVKYRSR